ncbi:IS66 family insertion sequence element accessory protein TnpA [Myxococcus xanthus]|uniref:IS66 family insertion sequence element accessory protein TnpB n=1 Tax=Myxococcus xanthus TaxID=34 RepID=A0A7Y4IH59_MYXXA|nr:IS66 family insertion sequence element accessory protein TnpB [Myxococcus xanthus]NOJ79202.1 IS66 family insertion sequence element accessory protein TnpB [Myxococcus xanthus]NOJ86582.1 IS66 family insertion sequence element accessory protein TnpB [Myxococcus xanthus]
MSKSVEKQEWFQVAESFEASGLTQVEFARQRGVRLSTVQSWVYRRRRHLAAKAEAVRLLPVQVMPPVEASTTFVEVIAEGGARLRFAVGTDVGYVARLVAALGR